MANDKRKYRVYVKPEYRAEFSSSCWGPRIFLGRAPFRRYLIAWHLEPKHVVIEPIDD